MEGDSYLDSETGFYDDVYGDYVFDEAEAQTSTCTVDQFTGKVLLTGAAEPGHPCDVSMAIRVNVASLHSIASMRPEAGSHDNMAPRLRVWT